MKRWYFIIIGLFVLCLAVPDSYAGCKIGECGRDIVLAQNITLPPPLIARIQRQFQGRVIGVTPSTAVSGTECREFTKDIMIAGKREEAFGTACLQPDGSWSIQNNYDVQVLTSTGRVIIVTVDPASGNILNVRN